MQCLLVAKNPGFSTPNGTTSNLTAFTNNEISCLHRILIDFKRENVHHWKIHHIDLVPLHVNVPEIRKQILACNAFGIQHLAKALLIAVAKTSNNPMRWHLTQPVHPGRLVGRVRLAGADIDPASDGLVDKGLPLLLQQLDQLLLGLDAAPDASVSVIEVASDGGLLG